MEQNLPIIAKKFLNVVRLAYSVLRKRVTKAKLLADFKIYMMMKRGKVAGKSAAFNLVFHHHRHHKPQLFPLNLDEGESCCYAPPEPSIDREMFAAAIEIAKSAAASPARTPEASRLRITDTPARTSEVIRSRVRDTPARTPEWSRLRITDSPLLLTDVEEDSHVDEAAEEFIMKFYEELRQQNSHL